MVKTVHHYFCDRCGGEYDEKKLPRILIGSAMVSSHNGLSHISTPMKNAELCPACSRALMKWWKGGE